METINTLETKLHIMKNIQYFCNYATRNGNGYKYEICGGNKFIRVAVEHTQYGGKSVHFFVNTTNGDVHKDASWKAPSKTVKYNISDADGTAELIRNWHFNNEGFTGGYLYANFKKVPVQY